MAKRIDPNARLALRLGGVVVVMVALSFAAVPFYSWFCATTGYGGTPSVAEKAPEVALERMVTVRFDANTMGDMPWTFRPAQKEMKVRIGEMNLAFYEAYNPTDKVTAGQAAYNVAPDTAGKFFDKIACFCFNLQVLQPGERVQMPVSFFVDPSMVDDPDAGGLKAVTLSYTMFSAEVPPADEQAGTPPALETRLAAGPIVVPNQTLEQ